MIKKHALISAAFLVGVIFSFVFFMFTGSPRASTAASSSGNSKKIWQERSSDAKLLANGSRPLASLSGLVRELKPSVVNIYTTQRIQRPALPGMQGRPGRLPDPLFDFFFGEEDPFGFFGSPGREWKRSSLGSGFIISPDGYALTNHHVVAQATEIKVKLVDDREFPAQLVGSDPRTDVALIKLQLKPGEKLPAAYLGDSDRIEVGDWVVAIGNPFGLGHTVTAGIISAKDRQIGHGPYDDFLQTDAAINPGNSGGPLFDTAGNVVGINTAIVAGGSGIGFAVPINLVKKLLPQLRDKGKVSRGWLGVGIQDLTPDLAAGFGVPPRSGVLVGQVFANGPAAKAGMKAGDIVTHIDGKSVASARQLTAAVAAIAPGRSVDVRIVRDQKTMTLRVLLGERDEGESAAQNDENPQTPAGATDLGMKLEPAGGGLRVAAVDNDSPAAGMVEPGDIILEVNRKKVRTVEDFRAAVQSSSRVLLHIARKNSQVFVTFSRN